jgi:hypothetical protein
MTVNNDGWDHWRWRLFLTYRQFNESMERFEARMEKDPEMLFWMIMGLKAVDVARPMYP